MNYVVDSTQVSKKAMGMVRASFNPSGLGKVDEVKVLTARLITLMQDGLEQDPRCAAIAIHQYEDAAMWAVKALTWNAAPDQAKSSPQATADVPPGPP
jgi:hypothetical protein